MEWKAQQRIQGGVRYDTEKAVLLASDCYWDGNNFERRGRNRFLFRTTNGRYFLQHRTQWQGEEDPRIEPIDEEEEAVGIYEGSRNQAVPFEIAFPGRVVQDA